MLTSTDRYQSGFGAPGTMPTEAWFSALLRGIDGPLGSVLDVGCAEGVMCALAAKHGASSVLGIGLHDDRMMAAREIARAFPQVEIREQDARDFKGRFRTVVFSMMAHWLGKAQTARFARMAERNFAIVFREANEHYERPTNGTWFPTLAELDETIRGVRTHEELVLTQDHDKRVWAVTYRTDITIDGTMVSKRRRDVNADGIRAFWGQPQDNGYLTKLATGRDLHGDAPFRPTNGAPVAELTPDEQEAVRSLIREIARQAVSTGWYPTDLSPRNIIVGSQVSWRFPKGQMSARLVDLDEIERHEGHVAPEYLPIWQRTLSTVGLAFTGDLRSLL